MSKKTEFKERLRYGDQYENVKLQQAYREAIEDGNEVAAQLLMDILAQRLEIDISTV